MDVVKTYRLYRKMNQFPDLMGQMRSTFMEVLEARGIITRKALYERALEELKADGLAETETNQQEYVDALVDHFFANNLDSHEIKNYVNLMIFGLANYFMTLTSKLLRLAERRMLNSLFKFYLKVMI